MTFIAKASAFLRYLQYLLVGKDPAQNSTSNDDNGHRRHQDFSLLQEQQPLDQQRPRQPNDESPQANMTEMIQPNQSKWLKFWKFVGPGYLVAVGYMDPVCS